MASAKDMFLNLTETAAATIKSYKENNVLLAEETVRNNRIDKCTSCEAFSNGRCALCGCFMTVKVWVSAAKCPANKW